jgi:hypothetical protein
VATPVLRRQRQFRQAPDRRARAQHRINELGQLVGAAGKAIMEVQPEPRQHGRWPAPASSGKLFITAFVCDHASLARTHDHAKAVLTHRDTPGTPVQDPRTARIPAGQVKEQDKGV